MLSSIEKVRCLVVEDDKFKLDSIRAYLQQALGDRAVISECQALATATAYLESNKFEIVVIDMSIHSHAPEQGAGSPTPLPSGGLDVLFEVNYLGHDSACIVLTQYTDILIEGVPVPIESAAAEIEGKFGITVAGCIQYSESSSTWKMDLDRILLTL